MMINLDTQSFHFLLPETCPFDAEITGYQPTSRNLSDKGDETRYFVFLRRVFCVVHDDRPGA